MFNGQKITKSKVITGVLVALTMYFIFFLIFGKYGFLSYSNYKREVTVKQNDLNKIQKENDKLSHKINSLKNDKLNSDLLDEQIRKNLGYTEEGEIIIYYK